MHEQWTVWAMLFLLGAYHGIILGWDGCLLWPAACRSIVRAR